MLDGPSYERLTHCRELEYILLGDLRDLLEEDTSAETVRWLTAVLDALLTTLPQDFELHSQQGYMQCILDEFPDWEPIVDRLESQYFELYHRLKMFRGQLHLGCDFTAIADVLRSDLTSWIGAFTVHQRHAQRLLLIAAHAETGYQA